MLDTGQIGLSGEALSWFRQGLAAATEHNYEQAVVFYNCALESCDTSYEVWYERGLALESGGDYRKAISSYDRALSLCKDEAAACDIRHDRGNAFQYGLGDHRQAIACYDSLLTISPNHEQAWQNRGNALLYGLSLPEEALVSYGRVLQINGDNPLAWRNRGNALLELCRFDAAIASYDRALALKPDDSMSWHSRILAAERGGLKDRQPTTSPVWYGSSLDESTFVEGDSDSGIIFASEFTATAEVNSQTQRQPQFVIEDDWGKREISLDRDRYLVGRDPSNDICLHSKFVSRQHAVITKVMKPDGEFVYQIADGNVDGIPSTNGLLVNGRKCRMLDLRAEDVIVFGPRIQAVYRLLPVNACR